MSVFIGYFNHRNDDRLYNAEEIGQTFNGLVTDGIFKGYLNEFEILKSDSGMSIKVMPGKCLFNNIWMLNDDEHNIDIPEASDFNRIDAVAIELDTTDDIRKMNIVYIQGEENNVYPNIIYDFSKKQYVLAYIKINSGASSIDNIVIENRIGKTSYYLNDILISGAPYLVPKTNSSSHLMITNCNGFTINQFILLNDVPLKKDMQTNCLYSIIEEVPE